MTSRKHAVSTSAAMTPDEPTSAANQPMLLLFLSPTSQTWCESVKYQRKVKRLSLLQYHRPQSHVRQFDSRWSSIIIITIIINEKISVAFSPKTARTRNTHKKDMFGRQRKKQEGQQRHQYEVANKYVFDVTRDVICG